MVMTVEQRKILQAIAAAEPVRGDAATWAVTAGWAVQAEDGDIDLTDAGRDALAARTARED